MIISLPIQPIALLKKSIQSHSLPSEWTLVQTENNEIACLIYHDSQQIPTVVSSLMISEIKLLY